jgi:hypothetical protein
VLNGPENPPTSCECGRSWLGWYHHTVRVTAAHGFQLSRTVCAAQGVFRPRVRAAQDEMTNHVDLRQFVRGFMAVMHQPTNHREPRRFVN